MSASDAHLTRMRLDGRVDHRRGQQFISGRGFAGDAFEEVHRVEPHGFASHPVKGGIATVLSARGGRDSAYAFGGENPELRPKGDDLTAGGTAIYDADGNIVSIVGRALTIRHSGTVHIKAATIILEGDVRLGGPDANRELALRDTLDSGGDSITANMATKVKAL
jgi:phage gp45-like